MSFYYNAQWQPSMGAYTPTIGSWGGGYSLGAWDESDFTAEQIQRSKDVGSAVEATILALGTRATMASSADEKSKADAAMQGFQRVVSSQGWDVSKGILSLDDDDKIYNVHLGINGMYEADAMEGNLLAHIDNAISAATGARIKSLGDLVDVSGKSYDDYFNAYYIEDNAPATAATKQPVADAVTGKTKVAKAKKTPIRRGVGVVGVLAVAGVVGGLWWLFSRTSSGRTMW